MVGLKHEDLLLRLCAKLVYNRIMVGLKPGIANVLEQMQAGL